MRKRSALVLFVLAVLALAGCGGGSGGSTPTSPSTPTASVPSAPASPKAATGVRRFAIGGDPWAATAAAGDIWVADHNDGTLTRIDGGTGRVLSRRAVAKKPASAIGAVTVGDRIWVGVADYDKKGNDLAATRSVDPRTAKLGPLRTGPHDPELTFGAGDRVAFIGAFGSLARIPFDGSHAKTIKLGNGQVRAIGVLGHTVWVGVRDPHLTQPDTIESFDARTLLRTGSNPQPGPVTAIAAASGSVWVVSASDGGGSVERLDAHGDQLAQIAVGETPTAIAADPSGVWVLDYFASTIDHISARTNKVDRALTFAPRASSDLLPDNSPHELAVLPGAVWVTVRDTSVAYRIPVEP